jgi:hypothetical protein
VKLIQERRDLIKVIAGIVVILAFVALAALAIAASRSDFSISAPGVSRPAAVSTPTGGDGDLAVPPPPEQPAASSTGTGAGVAPVAEVTSPAEAFTTPTTAPPASPSLTPAGTGKPCAALNLPAPAQVGGLQSLVRLIPLFGPFSPEAFAMVPAFQPGIDALGPLFPIFESMLDAAAPILDAATPPITQGEDAFFQAIGPLYLPVRPQVLTAEQQLAGYLEPLIRSLATAPGSECVVALEGLLASLPPAAQ